jgi:hypothetical protein
MEVRIVLRTEEIMVYESKPKFCIFFQVTGKKMNKRGHKTRQR